MIIPIAPYRSRLAELAEAAYLTKAFGDRVEVYDRGYALIATLTAEDTHRLHLLLLDGGKVVASEWDRFRGGASQERGNARWYDWPGAVRQAG